MNNNLNIKILVPGIIGNVLEWYDFLLYGFFAPVLAQLFFPNEDKLTSLLATFGTFAIGFLMRPLGSAIFGHFGDRTGRKNTLVISLFFMALTTALIGCLPTYSQVGVKASILLIICRLLQGLALGGEFGYSVYLIEHATQNNRGLYGGFAMASASLGMLLSSALVAIIQNSMHQTTLLSWGWRVPFLCGLILGVIGLYFRLRMPETQLFLKIQNAKDFVNVPLYYTLKQKPLLLLHAVLLTFLPALVLYIGFIYMPTYLSIYTPLSNKTTLIINTISMVFVVFGLPLVGHFSDKIGRKPFFFTSGIICCLAAYPLFLLALTGTLLSAIFVQLFFVVLLLLSYAILPVVLVEMVPTNIRYTTTALAYNVGNSIFGGTAPLLATFFIKETQNIMAPSFYLIISGIIMLITTFKLNETYKKELQ